MPTTQEILDEWDALTKERYQLSIEYGTFTNLMFEHRTNPVLYDKYLNELATLEHKTLINKNRMKVLKKLRGPL